jgi:hypothetical protein
MGREVAFRGQPWGVVAGNSENYDPSFLEGTDLPRLYGLTTTLFLPITVIHMIEIQQNWN